MIMTNVTHQRLTATSRGGGARRGVGVKRVQQQQRVVVARSEAGGSAADGGAPLPRLPRSPREQVTQAAEAVRRASSSSGKQLFEIEFSLPLIGATDLDDWPGGIRQQCALALPSFFLVPLSWSASCQSK